MSRVFMHRTTGSGVISGAGPFGFVKRHNVAGIDPIFLVIGKLNCNSDGSSNSIEISHFSNLESLDFRCRIRAHDGEDYYNLLSATIQTWSGEDFFDTWDIFTRMLL